MLGPGEEAACRWVDPCPGRRRRLSSQPLRPSNGGGPDGTHLWVTSGEVREPTRSAFAALLLGELVLEVAEPVLLGGGSSGFFPSCKTSSRAAAPRVAVSAGVRRSYGALRAIRGWGTVVRAGLGTCLSGGLGRWMGHGVGEVTAVGLAARAGRESCEVGDIALAEGN